MSRILCNAFLAKIDEQMDRAGHLAARLPEDRLSSPVDASSDWTARHLLGHLLDCMAGFCAALVAAEPQRLGHFQELRALPANRPVNPEEFRAHLETYRAHIAEGFGLLEDSDLARIIPTVFIPAGVPLATLLLGNLEHVINHKRQLFEFLKRADVNVGTRDLYQY